MPSDVTDIDLGPCRGIRFDQGAAEWVVLLPGAYYPTSAPLLWFAREAAMSAGRNALAVVDTYDHRADPKQWVEARADAAIRHLGDEARPIIIAKSISSLAASLAVGLSLPAVWLTPLISEVGTTISGSVLDGLGAASAPFLLIGGSADPSWDGARARSFTRGKALEIADADHSLQVPGDVERSLDALRRVSSAVAEFISTVDGAPRG